MIWLGLDGRDFGGATSDRYGGSLSLFRSGGMCYNHRAVERAVKHEVVPGGVELAKTAAGTAAPAERDCPVGTANMDASWYCPVCSQRLESRRCKLICPVCGYYMSCSDYY